jgi:hypothetical protein
VCHPYLPHDHKAVDPIQYHLERKGEGQRGVCSQHAFFFFFFQHAFFLWENPASADFPLGITGQSCVLWPPLDQLMPKECGIGWLLQPIHTHSSELNTLLLEQTSGSFFKL